MADPFKGGYLQSFLRDHTTRLTLAQLKKRYKGRNLTERQIIAAIKRMSGTEMKPTALAIRNIIREALRIAATMSYSFPAAPCGVLTIRKPVRYCRAESKG